MGAMTNAPSAPSWVPRFYDRKAAASGPLRRRLLLERFRRGTDADQRALLSRMRETRLTANGVVILDIFNPYMWSRDAGTRTVDEETSLTEALDFDIVANRFLDKWWFEGEEQPPSVQSLRCYSLADL